MGEVGAFLEDLVRIPSPSGREAKALDRFADEADRLGFEVTRREVGSVLARRGSGEVDLLLAGHIDTVPGQIPVRVEDGVLHGRGTVDAKGALAAFLHAAARAPDGLTVTVAALVGEETDSRGARDLLDAGLDADHVIVGEPSGADGIAVGYRGRRDLRLTVERPGRHPGHPDPGAADDLVSLLGDLRATAGTGFDDLGVRVRDLSSDEDGNRSRAGASVDLRFADEALLADVETRLAEADVAVEVLHREPPVLVDRSEPVVRALLAGIREQGARPRLVRKTGTCDMNLLQEVTGSICAYGPGDSSRDHTPDERIRLAEVETAVTVLEEALGSLSGKARL